MMVYENEDDRLLKAIQRAIFNKRENKNIAITGGTQKGKSRLAVTMAWRMDKHYAARRNISVIQPEKFLELLNTKAPRGFCPILDDAGLGMPSQDWYDFVVKRLNRRMQIVGHRGWIIIITTPHLSYLVGGARKILTDRIIVLRRYPNEGVIKFKFYTDVKYDDTRSKEYKSFPIMIYKSGKRRKVHTWKIKEAPKEVLNEFYEVEKEQKDAWSEEAEKDVKADIKKKRMKRKSSMQIVRDIADDIKRKGSDDYVRIVGDRRFVDEDLIAADYEQAGGRIAKRVKKVLERELDLH